MFVLILSTVLIAMALGEECPTQAQLATGSGCGSDCGGTPTYLKLNGTECTGCVDCQDWRLKEDGNCPDIFCTKEGLVCEGGEMRIIDSYFKYWKAGSGETCPLCPFKGCW